MSPLTLPVIQLVLTIIPFMIYMVCFGLILSWCSPLASENVCYTLFGMIGLLSVFSAMVIIESMDTLVKIKENRKVGYVKNYIKKPQELVVIFSSLVSLVNIVMVGITDFVDGFSIFDGVFWLYLCGGVYEVIITVIAIKIMADGGEVDQIEYSQLTEMSKN